MIKFNIINGPNINVLEQRKLYGTNSLANIKELCITTSKQLGIEIEFFQNNHEGDIIDYIQNINNSQGIIINAAAYTHTSIAIADALLIHNVPIIEVHISNIYAREKFRNKSYISPIATAVIAGMGIQGYKFAIEYLAQL